MIDYGSQITLFPELRELPSSVAQLHDFHGYGHYDPQKLAPEEKYIVSSCFGEEPTATAELLIRLNNKKIVFISPCQLPKFQNSNLKIIYFPIGYAIYPQSNHMPRMELNLDRIFNKTFLSLNNRAQWPRQALYHFVEKFNLYDKFYFSYHMEDRFNIGKELLWNQTNDIVGTKNWFNEGLDFNLLFDRLPITLDKFSGNDWSPGNLEYYNTSFCSVVTETYIDENQHPFFTEKIFKPLAYGHPMLVHSSQGALTRLRELGFETFSSILDESYDQIESPQERFEEILRQILELSNKSNNELSLMFEKIKPVLRHNYDRFWNGLLKEYDDKIKDVKEEILDYFEVDE